jgi:hypothetical protein
MFTEEFHSPADLIQGQNSKSVTEGATAATVELPNIEDLNVYSQVSTGEEEEEETFEEAPNIDLPTGEEEEGDQEEEDQEEGDDFEDQGSDEDTELSEKLIFSNLNSVVKDVNGFEISEESLDNAEVFFSDYNRKVREKILSEDIESIKGEVRNEWMAENGLTEDSVELVTGNTLGIDANKLKGLNTINSFLSQEIEPDSSQEKALYEIFHMRNNVPKELIDQYVASDLQSEDKEAKIEMIKKILKGNVSSELGEISTTYNNRLSLRKEYYKKQREQVAEVMAKSEIGENTYSQTEKDEYLKARTAKTETITLPDGREKKVTAFEKMKHEESVADKVAKDMEYYFSRKDPEKFKTINDEKKKKKSRGKWLRNIEKTSKGRLSFQKPSPPKNKNIDNNKGAGSSRTVQLPNLNS